MRIRVTAGKKIMKDLVTIAQALSDESRVRILKSLDGSTLCLCHLTKILAIAPSTISKHLRILAEAGLITAWQEGRWRYYRWTEQEGSPCAQRALEWVRDSLRDDPVAAEDASRRAVSLHTCAAPIPKKGPKRVLFLCTGNSCRSQMAEGLLRRHAGESFEIFSAGLNPREIPALTYEVMDEIGVDIRGQRPKSLMEFLGREFFHYVITVCENAQSRCPVFPGVHQRLYWPVEDPLQAQGDHQERLKVFRRVRDELDSRIRTWLSELGIKEAKGRRSRPHSMGDKERRSDS